MLGAGPAGLTAAYVLAQLEERGAVFEADDVVGGIARTVTYEGCRFDLGGHRFYTKLKPIERLWESMLGDDFLTRRRLSRIYYRGKYFLYPLEARNVVSQLGIVESVRCAASYAVSVLRRKRRPETFEEWVTGRFGRRLYETFFRTYTQKVWGIPGDEISAEWAAQRIKDFSFRHALMVLLHLQRAQATTLIERFRYPRLGPGQMWEAFAAHVKDRGIGVELNHRVTSIVHSDGRVHKIAVNADGVSAEYDVDGVLSSIPLSDLVLALEPAAPDHVLDAARALKYRDLCVVVLILDGDAPFRDNWVYVHDPTTQAGRVQNFGAWSESMVRPGTTCLGVEYFCFAGDAIWELPADEAVALASQELARIGLIDSSRVVDGLKIQVPKAYPVYDESFRGDLDVLQAYLAGFENLQTCGRNGLHRYNNQDHSMWTAILATLNLAAGASYDVWTVNTEADYLEEGDAVEAALESQVMAAFG